MAVKRLGPAAVLAVALAAGPAAAATEVAGLFPSDHLTRADPTALTGRQVALPLPDCKRDPSGCDEVRLLNELDGFSVTPRLAVRFSLPIALETLTSDSIFIVPIWAEPRPWAIPVGQYVWDARSLTLYARPDRALLQQRRYAVVVTTRIGGADGRPLTRVRGLRSGAGALVDAHLLERLRAIGVAPRQVAGLSVFTTQSVTTGLERMRAVVDAAPPGELRWSLGPGGARSVYPRAAIERLEVRRQIAVRGEAMLAPATPLPLELVPPREVALLAFGAYRAPTFLVADRHIPTMAGRGKTAQVQGDDEVHVTLVVPQGVAPPPGWPVAIFGHGFGGERHGSLLAIAGTLARHGFATAAINVTGHGGGAAGQLALRLRGGETIALPSGGRGVDLDGDGRIGATEGVGTLPSGPVALISVRDGLRQTAADLMQLVRTIRAGVDLDGDGQPDLDRERIVYVGQSFGGIYGTLLLAVAPHLRAGVLNVPGGPIVEIARQASVFRPRVIEALRLRTPSLLNGADDFEESIPPRGAPPVGAPVPGALAIQEYLDRAEWIGQAASPVAFAPYLRTAPLEGLRPKPVLIQMAAGDRTVPNPTTESLIRAGKLEFFTSILPPQARLPERFRNPHGFLLWSAFPEVAEIGDAAQEQAARFLHSGGWVIDSMDGLFSVGFPAVGVRRAVP